jgi:hypothetical protein
LGREKSVARDKSKTRVNSHNSVKRYPTEVFDAVQIADQIGKTENRHYKSEKLLPEKPTPAKADQECAAKKKNASGCDDRHAPWSTGEEDRRAITHKQFVDSKTPA